MPDYQSITKLTDIKGLQNNSIILEDSNSFKMNGTKIIFSGKNNILFCEKNVTLDGSTLRFSGNDSIIYLSSNTHVYRVNFQVFNNSVLFVGTNCYFNGTLTAICSEQKHIIIGRECIFSFNIYIRTADPHLIYSLIDKKRINPSKSVFIGDHIWVGQNAMLLKGTKIHSGSILAASAVISSKAIPPTQYGEEILLER